MGRHDALRVLEETALHVRRLGRHYVQRRAGDHAAVERVRERLLVHHPAARGVHEKRVRLHQRETLGVDQLRGLGHERTVHAHVVGIPQNGLQWQGTRHERVVVDHLHVEAGHHLLDAARDVAIADQAERAVRDVPVHALHLAPGIAGLRAGVVLRDLPDEAQEQRHGVLGHALGDRLRRIVDADAVLLRPRARQRVDAGAGAEERLQVRHLREDARVHAAHVRTESPQYLHVAERREQVVRRRALLRLEVAERADPLRNPGGKTFLAICHQRNLVHFISLRSPPDSRVRPARIRNQTPSGWPVSVRGTACSRPRACS